MAQAEELVQSQPGLARKQLKKQSHGGALLPGGDNMKLKNPPGQVPVVAAGIRRRTLERMADVFERQLSIALHKDSSNEDSTRSAHFLAKYTMGMPKRVELGNEAAANALLEAVECELSAEALTRVKARMMIAMAQHGPATDDTQIVDVTPPI